MTIVLQRILIISLILLILKTAIAHATQKPDSDRYGPLSPNESCKKDYFENTEYGKGRFCTKCEPGYENPNPENQNRCTGRNNTSDIPKLNTLIKKDPRELAPLVKSDSDRYGPLSSDESCKKDYFEDKEYGKGRFCTKCEPGFENPNPENQNRCTKESTPPEQNHDEKRSTTERKNTSAEDPRESIQPYEKDNKTTEIKKVEDPSLDSEETGVDSTTIIVITLSLLAFMVIVVVLFLCIRKQRNGKNADTEKNEVGESGLNYENSQEMDPMMS